MIIYDKAPNTSNGTMGGISVMVGQEYPIPSKGILKLLTITEGVGRNGKPIVTLAYEDDIIEEIPDYGIHKFRDYGKGEEKSNKDK